MPSGLSIHIGLNAVDPAHYAGWDGQLAACEADAKDMEAIAKKAGFQSTLLLTKTAKADAVIGAITEAGEQLASGDILFLTYSGHGGQLPDSNSDEDDRMDETWCLFDRELIDDELYTLWSRFQKGVRIFVLSDSCHSGSVTRAVVELVGDGPRFKALPEQLERKVYDANKDVYDEIQKTTTAFDKTELPPSVLLISGCQDNQTSADGDRNGLFTGTLRTVWGDGKFKGSYRRFGTAIVKKMPPWQSPNYFWAGEPDLKFERQHPFSI